MQRLLLLSTTTGYQAQRFKEAAERSGAAISLATDRCHVLEDPWQDGAIAVKFQQPEESAEAIARAAEQRPISGLIAIGDLPTATASAAAARLKLRFHPPHAVRACRNKFVARERYREAGMLTPWFTRVPADEDARTVAARVPYPCVLKPLGLSASRGVIRANTQTEFVAAFERIRVLLAAKDVRILRDESSDWIQIEEYIPGIEVAVECLVSWGQVRILAIFDKPDPLEGPFFEETIYVTPSRLPEAAQGLISATVRQAARAIGLVHGPVHAELRLNERGAWMLDIAARPIGGLCARALRFADDMPLEELLVRHALGEKVEAIPRERCAAGVMMIPIPHAGVYEGVDQVDEALEVPHIEAVEITAKPAQRLVPLPEGASYLGFIFARAETPGEVEQALRLSHAKLHFQIAENLPVL